MNPAQYRAAIIGAGKIAWSVAPALKKASFKIISIISKDINSAKQLASKLKVSDYSDNINNIPANANLFIIAVPDGQIKPVSLSLSSLELNYKKSLFVHLSGVENADALESLASKGAKTASLHIMQTFPARKKTSIAGCKASVEASSPRFRKELAEVAYSIGLIPFSITSEQKVLLHLSGVFCSNFMAGNFFAAENISGLGSSTLDIMKKISVKTLDNINTLGSAKTLSGPVERGDITSIENHLAALDKAKKKLNNDFIKKLRMSYIIQSLLLLDAADMKLGELSANHIKIGRMLRKELKKTAKSF